MNEVKDKVNKDNVATKVKKARHRSPNYPYLSLGKAVEKAKVLYETFKLNWVPERTAHETWGNAPFGSQGLLSTAALKAYGLISLEGSGKARKVIVTDHARRILLDADEKEELLRQSALMPPLHKELWEHYDGFLPKGDEALRKYLLVERGFNDQAVDGFIAQFRATIALTRLESLNNLHQETTKTNQDDGSEPPNPPSEENLVDANQQPGLAITPKAATAITSTAGPQVLITRNYPIPLKGGRTAILQVPYPYRQPDIDKIKKWLDDILSDTIEEDGDKGSTS